jgi:hypothetical protein
MFIHKRFISYFLESKMFTLKQLCNEIDKKLSQNVESKMGYIKNNSIIIYFLEDVTE